MSLNSSNNSIDVQDPILGRDERRSMGIAMISLILPFYMPYWFVLMIFVKAKIFRKHMAYNLMVAVGLMDLYTLTGYIMMGLQLIFDTSFGFVYEKITGGLISGGLQGMVIFSILLTINRSNSIMGYLNGIIRDDEKFWKIIFVVTNVVVFLLLFTYMLPNFGVVWDQFSFTVEWIRVASRLEKIINNLAFYGFGVCFFLYLASFICILYKYCKLIKTPLEMLLFTQTFVIILYKGVNSYLWLFCKPATQFGLFLVLIFESCYHPFMYLILNKRLRKECIALVKPRTTIMTISTNAIGPNAPHTFLRNERSFLFLKFQT